MAAPLSRLNASELRAKVPPLPEQVHALEGIAGQDRAREALALGLAIGSSGYGIVVSGPPGSGRNSLVRLLVEEAASNRPPSGDWIYLHNFDDPRRPRAVRLETGNASVLSAALDELSEACRRSLPAAFDSESYETRVQQALHSVAETRDATLNGLQVTARGLGFLLTPTPSGLATAPIGADGHPISPQAFAVLPEDVRGPIEQRGEKLNEAIVVAMRKLRQLDIEARSVLQALDREIMRFVLGPIMDELAARFTDPELLHHFVAIQEDIGSNLDTFKRLAGVSSAGLPSEVLRGFTLEREELLQRYRVNVFVTHSPSTPAGAPVVVEPQPSLFNLFGRIEFENRMGSLVTDFTHVRPGALHAANGGFTILQAPELLSNGIAWTKLKVALKTGHLAQDDMAEMMPLPVVGLAPEPIPLSVKVILVGPPLLLSILDAVDPDFHELFKIRAEFEPDTRLDSSAVENYAWFVHRTVEEQALLAFSREAIAEVIQFGARLAARNDRVSTRLGLIADLCIEASQAARALGDDEVTAGQIAATIASRDRRSGLAADRLRELMAEGTLRIETVGEVVGQLNGLAVFQSGDSAFGMPTRITCRTGLGRRGVIDIERETERSGAIHTKGVLVLEGFLVGTFGREFRLSFNASLTFEQSYDEVEGDSASAAELVAIVASLADLPLRQDIAVTGSIDQFGRIQAVGGVTQKVEGFFDACMATGMTGTEGVVIPDANRVNLTLRADVAEAVERNQFHIWTAMTVQEVLRILTGVEAGEPGTDGLWAEGTIFRRVAKVFQRMSDIALQPQEEGRR